MLVSMNSPAPSSAARTAHAVGEVLERPHPAGGDHRDVDGAGHGTRELEVVAVAGSVAVHAGEHELAGAELGGAHRPRQGVDPCGRTPAVHVDLPRRRPALHPAPRNALGVDGDDDALRPETLGAAPHQLGVLHGGGVHGHLVGAGREDQAHVVHAAQPAADRERDEHLFRAARRQLGDDLAPLVRRRDVEKHELVRPLGVVARGELDRIAGVAQADEVHPLDHAPVAHVEARDDAFHVHRLLLPRAQPAKTACASPSVNAFS